MKQTKSRGFVTGLLLLCSSLVLSTIAQAQNFTVRGRLQMDALYGISEAEDFVNGFNNRRARMGMQGRVHDNWDGRIEIDFADGGVDPKDFRLRRSFDHGGRLWIGQFKVPQGLNQLTSSVDITFIERSSVSNIVPDSRRIGVAYELFPNDLGFKSMVFGRALGQRGALNDDMPLGYAFRAVYAPEVNGSQWHVGASMVYEDLKSNPGLRYSDRPEARDSKGGSVRYIDVSVPDAETTFKTGIEALYINGPFSLEGEYLQMVANTSDSHNPTFNGYHVQSSYVFNGARRYYSKGLVGGVIPAEGSSGAWEVAIRYSVADLQDDFYSGGDKQKNVTFALNRYVTSKLRFMGNLVIVNTDHLERTPVLGMVRAAYCF